MRDVDESNTPSRHSANVLKKCFHLDFGQRSGRFVEDDDPCIGSQCTNCSNHGDFMGPKHTHKRPRVNFQLRVVKLTTRKPDLAAWAQNRAERFDETTTNGKIVR